MLGYNLSPGDASLPPSEAVTGHPSLHFLLPPHIRPGLLKLCVTLSLLTHVFGSLPQLNASHQVLGHVSAFNVIMGISMDILVNF